MQKNMRLHEKEAHDFGHIPYHVSPPTQIVSNSHLKLTHRVKLAIVGRAGVEGWHEACRCRVSVLLAHSRDAAPSVTAHCIVHTTLTLFHD